MAAPSNLSFETAGATPGSALAWSVAVTASALAYADYDAVAEGAEDFEEGWLSNETALFAFVGVGTDLTLATYDAAPEAKEDFEEGWSNEPYFLDLPALVSAPYGTSPVTAVEHFEEGWLSNETMLYAFVGVGTDLELAAYDAADQGAEDFEEEWSSNENYLTAFVGIFTDLTPATYSTTIEYAEQFDPVLLGFTFGVNLTTNVFTAVGHGCTEDEPLTFEGAGALPEPFADEVTYYAVGVAADTFTLAESPGGPAIDVTAAGGRDLKLVPNRAKYWVDEATTL